MLTLAYMNAESLRKSIETKETWFYSRSRQELWHKGATSGNTQTIVEMKLDCDRDAIVVLVQSAGPACHTGAISCFSEQILKEEETVKQEANLADYQILVDLEQIIDQREKERPEGAYTTYLI